MMPPAAQRDGNKRALACRVAARGLSCLKTKGAEMPAA